MKIHKKVLSILMSVLVMIPTFTSVAFADEAAPENTLQLSGSIEWEDNENSEQFRPESVTVDLYDNGTLIGSTTTSESEDWQFSFDVDANRKSDTNEKAAYRFEQQIPNKYVETEHVDPVIDSGTIVLESWDKYTPCNELDIPFSKLSDSVIVGKLTGKYADTPTAVVWTRIAMTDEEHIQIDTAIRNINGIGNPKNVEFYSGDIVNVEEYGLSINALEGKVLMNRPDCWALFAGAEYTKQYSQINNGLLTNTIILMPTNPVTPPQQDEPLIPSEPPILDGPSTPGETTIPESPTVPDNPSDPETPPTSDEPSKPVTPPTVDAPSEPVTPIVPGETVTPDDSVTPEDSSTTDDTVVPDNKENSDQVSDTKKPADINGNESSSDKNITATDYPQTGDYSNLIAWISLATLAVTAICLIRRKLQK